MFIVDFVIGVMYKLFIDYLYINMENSIMVIELEFWVYDFIMIFVEWYEYLEVVIF